MGVLGHIRAILFGRPGGHIESSKFREYDEAILQVVRDEEQLTIPVVTHMDFGHTDPMLVLPYGQLVRIHIARETLEFLESAVV
jgi:muramoyltetrapeptide carboxypeptidase LdcA involved in peptidoglycan recycling